MFFFSSYNLPGSNNTLFNSNKIKWSSFLFRCVMMMSNIKFFQLNQQKSVTSLKQAGFFFYSDYLQYLRLYMCVSTLNWELHTHIKKKRWRTKKKRGGGVDMKRSSRFIWEGNKRVRKAATSPLLETNINLSSKKYIYNLTYIFIFRLKHKSVIQLEPPPLPSSFRTVDTLVKLSFRSITGPLLHLPFYTCVSDPDQCWLQINRFY